MTPLELFLAGMSSVMVTISTCAHGIPTVIIKSISVPLHWGWVALLQRLKQFICRLLTARWHLSTTCQRASLSVESHHKAWHFPLCPLSSFFLSCSPSRARSEGPSGDKFKLSVDKGFPDWQDEPSCQPLRFRTTRLDTFSSLLYCSVNHSLRVRFKHKKQMIRWYQKIQHSCWSKERRSDSSGNGNVWTERESMQSEIRGFLVQTCWNCNNLTLEG